ncbi:YolD-like family protein [Alkalibacillus aidingensis]|uniref:YolD-like family protein n=1 Tax=Alkalibacillus aidingensis TaxID=2747607 RepID=UPI001660F1AC|nr:YolD-like family protein [Alkalibacillus aidingensis]
MHHDRGSIKWASLMLPEHVKALQEVWREEEVEKQPLLDEQQIEEYAFLLSQAYQEQSYVQVTYFLQGHYHHLVGKVLNLEVEPQTVRLETKQGDRQSIRIATIKQISL